jgi:outer membrane protein OmpA-like peptidoglycan-associated protein
MASATTREIRGGTGGAVRRALVSWFRSSLHYRIGTLGAIALALSFAGGACSPVETWRNLTGASKNDPNPATTPNARNLAAGAAIPYPNLATVPPPPTQEMSEAERKKLTQGLVADRTNLNHTSQQLRADMAEPEPSPSPPATTAGAPATVALAAVPSAPPPPGSAPVTKTAAPTAPANGAIAAASAAPRPAAAAVVRPAGAAVPGTPTAIPSGLRKAGQPPEPGPTESSLFAPQISETPQPEQAQAPPPHLAATPKGGSAHLPAPRPAPPLPAAIPAFQPSPPPPVLASPAPTRTAMTAPTGKQPTAPVPVATPVAEIAFAAGSENLSDAAAAALDKVAALYRQNPGALRVVGYAAVGSGAVDPLHSFRSALDHAQTVAAALAKAGIPADKITVEASPTKSGGGGDRAEISLLH